MFIISLTTKTLKIKNNQEILGVVVMNTMYNRVVFGQQV